MNEDIKVYTPTVIADNPFPDGVVQPASEVNTKSKDDVYGATKVTDQDYPFPKIAQEVLSTSLNTASKKILQEFALADSGGLRIGKLQPGISGEVVLTPAGITARDMSGNITFALDGDTGDAFFAGKIQSGALITGLVAIGSNSIIIDGETDRITMTDDSGFVRILIGEDS